MKPDDELEYLHPSHASPYVPGTHAEQRGSVLSS